MYIKTEWKDRIIDPISGQLLEKGTSFTAKRANNIEKGIEDAHKTLEGLDKDSLGLGNVENVKQASEEEFTNHVGEEASIFKKGHVQLSNAVTSTDETKAATPNAVKKAYDRADQAFLSASNGKTAIIDAVAGVDPEVVIPIDPTFAQLATAILQIYPGKKFATGDYTVSQEIRDFPSFSRDPSDTNLYVNNQRFIQITGLTFEPTTIFVYIPGGGNGSSTFFKKEGIQTRAGRLVVASDAFNSAYPFFESSALSVTIDGFILPIASSESDTVKWIAYE